MAVKTKEKQNKTKRNKVAVVDYEVSETKQSIT